jgi:uncharacterized membrane protein
MEPSQLSYELRKVHTPDLDRRRWIIGLSLLGAAMAKIVTAYQTGLVQTLPDPPLGIFDSERVDASDYAYKRLSTPDGVLMLMNYGVTAWLAAAGGANRASTTPALPIAMGLKALGDSLSALKLAQEEWAENKALCVYCQIATMASIASVALAVPEVLTAIRGFQSGGADQPFGRLTRDGALPGAGADSAAVR